MLNTSLPEFPHQSECELVIRPAKLIDQFDLDEVDELIDN